MSATFYVPSFYGDIKLDAEGEDCTRVAAVKLTAQERDALKVLLTKAVAKGWTDVAVLEGGGSVVLKAPIAKVSTVLAKALKPSRKIVTAVRVEGGKITEVTEGSFAEVVPSEPPARKCSGCGEAGHDARTCPNKSAAEAEEKCPTCGERGHGEGECWKTAEERRKTVGASVAVPCKGCAMPAFPAHDVAATRVLSAFLTPAQLSDFHREQCFVATGAETAHRYLVSSRHAQGRRFGPWRLESAQSWKTDRPLAGLPYDLDEGRTLCVHDWEVPAAEEMLATLVCLSLPGHEGYLRTLPPEHVAR